jgi:hypothetical protein
VFQEVVVYELSSIPLAHLEMLPDFREVDEALGEVQDVGTLLSLTEFHLNVELVLHSAQSCQSLI